MNHQRVLQLMLSCHKVRKKKCAQHVQVRNRNTFIIPHVIYKSSTCSLPFVTHYVSDLQYISIEYLSCIFLCLEYQTSSPSFLTSPQKSNLSVQNQGHIGDRWHNTYIEAQPLSVKVSIIHGLGTFLSGFLLCIFSVLKGLGISVT